MSILRIQTAYTIVFLSNGSHIKLLIFQIDKSQANKLSTHLIVNTIYNEVVVDFPYRLGHCVDGGNSKFNLLSKYSMSYIHYITLGCNKDVQFGRGMKCRKNSNGIGKSHLNNNRIISCRCLITLLY